MAELKDHLSINAVVVVGKLKNKDDKTVIPEDLAGEDLIKAIRAKFKFVQDTTNNETLTKLGLGNGKFIHVQFNDPGGEMITLPNGKTVKRSKRVKGTGFDVLFQSKRPADFEDIKGELLTGKFEPVGKDPNSGKIILTDYGLIGYWDEFATGFDYNPHYYDNADGGKLKPLMAHPKKDDGTYDTVKAVSNMARHFIYEDEIDNLEVLREQVRARVIRFKIEKPVDNTKPNTPGIETKPVEPTVVKPETDEP